MALDTNLRRILQTHQDDIAFSVQQQHLLPILREKDLVSCAEFQSLSSPTSESSYDKNRRLVSIVSRKGKNAFDLFVEALQIEKHHLGHTSLAEKLQAEQENLQTSRPRSRPGTSSQQSPAHSPLLAIKARTIKDEARNDNHPKMEKEVKTDSHVSEASNTVNPLVIKTLENRITSLENGVKTIQETIESLSNLVQKMALSHREDSIIKDPRPVDAVTKPSSLQPQVSDDTCNCVEMNDHLTANTTNKGGHYAIIKKLAKGRSGNFWLARNHQDRVVVKIASSMDVVIQETNALKRLSRTNIIRIVHADLETPQPPSLTIIFEYAENNNLLTYLKRKKGDLSKQQLLEIAIDVACGMKQLEKCSVVHCDLRAHSVLVDSDIVCKVASFNKALCLEHDEVYRICRNQQIAIRWQAPEVLMERKFSIKSDVWAFGVLLFEIFSFGSTPYPDMNADEVKDGVMKKTEMPKPEDCPREVYQVMRNCFLFDPMKRSSFADLHQHLLNIQMKKYSGEPEFEN